MRICFVLLSLLALTVILIPGCSGVGEESYSSSWTSLPAKVSGTDVEVATPAAELKMTVLPAQASVQNENSVPVSVSLVGSGSADMELQVAMSSVLGGKFDPEKGEFNNGSFMTTYTAPADVTGSNEIVALAGSLLATSAIQILPKAIVAYQVQVVPADLTLGRQQTTSLTVKVTDSNGWSVNDSDVILTSSLQGVFGSTTGTTENGVFTTTFTSGETSGNCKISAVAQGTSGAATIVISVVPEITIIPTLNPAAAGSTQQVSVKVTDERKQPLNGVKVFITSSNGGAFASTTEETGDDGFACFEYTAPAGVGVVSDKLIVQALGLSASADMVLQ